MIHRCALQPEPDVTELASPIDVFWLSLDALNVSALTGVLSVDERFQLSRLRIEKVRRRRMAARAMLRCLLSAFLHVEPHRILIERGEAGKPSVAWPETPIQFNLSHSEALLAIAVSQTVPVGIDVEVLSDLLSPLTLARLCVTEESKKLHCDQFGERIFPPAQLTCGDRSDRELLDAWVQEEARRKATGAGWFGVPIGGDAEPGSQRDSQLLDRTAVQSILTPVSNFLAALAIDDPERTAQPVVRPWWVSADEISSGTLNLHAQRLGDESLGERFVADVRSATYC